MGAALSFKPPQVPEQVPRTDAYAPEYPPDPSAEIPDGRIWSYVIRSPVQSFNDEVTIAQTQHPSTDVDLILNAQGDAGYANAIVRIYASAGGLRCLMLTASMPAASDSNFHLFQVLGTACDFWVATIDLIGGQVPAVPLLAGIVGYGREASSIGSSGGSSGTVSPIVTHASGAYSVLYTDTAVLVDTSTGTVEVILPGGAGSIYGSPTIGMRTTIKNVSTDNINTCEVVAGVGIEDPANPGAALAASPLLIGPSLGPGWSVTYVLTAGGWRVVA